MVPTRRTFLQSASCAALTPFLGSVARSSEERFSPGAVRSDLDAMWAAMLDVSVYPFRASDRTSVERAYRSARTSMRSSMTVRQALTVIAPVFGALNDGHVSLAFPGELNEAAYRFPVFLALSNRDDALVVAADRTATTPPQSLVVAIDGVDAATIKTLTLAREMHGMTLRLGDW